MVEYITDDEDFLEIVDQIICERKTRRDPRSFKRRSEMDHWSDEEFIQRFRLTKGTVLIINNLISKEISHSTEKNNALSPLEMILITLRFLASSSFYIVCGDMFHLHKSTVSRIVNLVTREIAKLAKQYIYLPRDNDEIKVTQQNFYNIAKFPGCIGAIDCTHVRIQSPGGNNAELYRNRKGYFSFNVQVICDSKLKIMDIVCRWPGSSHDAHIFRMSQVKVKFERGDYKDAVLVGDSGYGVKKYLITPLANPRNEGENLFNESQIRTRNPVERCFGVLKRRFSILGNIIRLNINNVEALVVCCAVLHNIALSENDEMPENDDNIFPQIENMEEIENRDRDSDDSTRKKLITYFNSLL